MACDPHVWAFWKRENGRYLYYCTNEGCTATTDDPCS